MSGFAGIFQRDGQPADRTELERLKRFLLRRPADAAQDWLRGSIGLTHARFTTDPARDGEAQPLVLDDRFWIAGHIRLDAREELSAALDAPRECSDTALVLRAYRAWGEACLERVHGDFAFAIWDEREQRLTCARDRFGVRPFFYAPRADTFVFANTLECVRRHPRVVTTLDETAIADYLVAGHLLEPQLTFFAGIRRLPPAHVLVVTAQAMTLKRYWSLPVEAQLRHRDARTYVQQFVELLGRSVADRVPSGPVALHLSGGLDSGCIGAALAGR
jgi:asparagine synthase (glutamine-hydrolysing)